MINEERIIAEFTELVAVPCPSKDERMEADIIYRKLQELGMNPQIDEVAAQVGSSVGNVWGILKGNLENVPAVFFEAHMDSVAPTTGTTVIRKNGILYSDGTTTLGGDDKAGIVAIFEALRVIKENNIPHGDIQVCFTVAEEIGCLGAKFLDKNLIKADIGYSLDGGGKPGLVFNAAPRLVELEVKVIGKSAHAGIEPEKGINSIMLAAQALAAIPQYGRLDEETTLNVGKINGGLAPNIVAEETSFVIDMRCPKNEKLDQLIEATKQVLTTAVEQGGGVIEINVVENCPAIYIDKNSKVVEVVLEASNKLGLNTGLQGTGGCSDANFFNGHGLPMVVLATGMEKVHTTEEFLEEEDLFDLTKLVVEIIKTAATK